MERISLLFINFSLMKRSGRTFAAIIAVIKVNIYDAITLIKTSCISTSAFAHAKLVHVLVCK